jgi:hypothetical protein
LSNGKSKTRRLRELEAAATPAPWLTAPFTTTPNNMSDIDAQLIAEMRNTLPKLLAVVEAAKKLSQEYDKAFDLSDIGFVDLKDALAALED